MELLSDIQKKYYAKVPSVMSGATDIITCPRCGGEDAMMCALCDGTGQVCPVVFPTQFQFDLYVAAWPLALQEADNDPDVCEAQLAMSLIWGMGVDVLHATEVLAPAIRRAAEGGDDERN